MIECVTISHFKKIIHAEIYLTDSVALIGPNNSGKSTVFQALCLWQVGVTRYLETYAKKDSNNTQGKVVLNRESLTHTPIKDVGLLWKDKRVMDIGKKGQSAHIPIEITVKGTFGGIAFECKTVFTFVNTESLVCRVVSGVKEMSQIYQTSRGIRFEFLQPMSGISVSEDRLTKGSIERRLGEGKTAEVLRNICYGMLHPETPSDRVPENSWKALTEQLKKMFGLTLHPPEYLPATGLLELSYTENNIRYDISSAGRGFLQTLLLLAYMYARPESVLLLDEPDAHLEVIRQREIYRTIRQTAQETDSQLMIASHSEVVLNEAAQSGKVIALIDHQILEINSSETKHLTKALTEIGWDKYYLARLKGHILFLEGATDLEMLLAFGRKLNHPAVPLLTDANIIYLSGNQPNEAVKIFTSIATFFKEVKAVALFDRISYSHKPPEGMEIIWWRKRELENYFATPEVLLQFARHQSEKNAYDPSEAEKTMNEAIINHTVPAKLKDLNDNWWDDMKASDDWFNPIFKQFFAETKLPPRYKKDYSDVIDFVAAKDIDPEITEKLNTLLSVIR